MLKKHVLSFAEGSANGTGLLFGLFGLSRLFGFWVEQS